MRTLVIGGDFPWPADTGARLRLAMILRGLVMCGPTELISVVSKFRTYVPVPEGAAGLAKVSRIGFDNRVPTGPRLLPTLAQPGMPLGLPWRDRPEIRAFVDSSISGQYDLVWFYGIRQWVLAGEPTLAPAVIDLIDLEDQKILARLAEHRPPPRGIRAQARALAAEQVSREDARRWQRLQRRASRGGVTTVVCSELDAARAAEGGVERIAVIPNGYDPPAKPLGRVEVGSPPTVLFQGLLTYPPNAEAARWAAIEIGPALAELVPDTQIRLVGSHSPELAYLGSRPSVTLTGKVPDIADELARADVVLVPLRSGSGTRLKIIEAFAHRIPVVSTGLGAEGLGAEHGVHLLLAESTEGLAECCRRLLTEPRLREELVERAHLLFLERFQSSVVEAKIGRLARRVTERSPSDGRADRAPDPLLGTQPRPEPG